MSVSQPLSRVREALDSHREILLTAHVNPDGDALGSEMALFYFLRDRGKKVLVLNATPTPAIFRFLDPGGDVRVYEPGTPLPIKPDLVLALDLNKWERLGVLEKPIRSLGVPVICIDHHPIEEHFGDLHAGFEEASATGEIVYDLLRDYGPLSLPMAEALYAAIMTDTGSFRFSNTSAKTHRVVAELIDLGVNPPSIYSQIFEESPEGRLKLLGEALRGLKLGCEGRLAWMTVTQKMFQDVGASNEDTENFIDVLRTVAGVEVAILFVEMGNNLIRTSLRSKGRVKVSQIAIPLGGGGHPFASGVRVKGSLKGAVERVVREAEVVIRAALEGKGASAGAPQVT